jgi:SdrD B-like domain/Secretion system C-terminal sorting domain
MKRTFTSFKAKICIQTGSLIFLTLLFLLIAQLSKAQIFVVLSKETFPNQNNTGLTYPINQGHGQYSGGWWSYSTGKATLATSTATYSPVTNALKLYHWSTTGLGASNTYGTSPSIDLSNPGCNGKYDFSFNLYTNNCLAGDNNAYLALEFSNNGGSTWNTIWQMTSGQMYTNYGPNAVQNVWVILPSTYFTANFKYRFRGHMNANNPNNFYPFIDEPTVYAYACSDMMSIGNLVWKDMNMNGIKDAAETGMPGITVELSKDNDGDGLCDWDFTKQTTTTDANGNYKFENLTAGNYLLALLNISTSYRLVTTNAGDPDENIDNNNNGWYQSQSFSYVDGGWITLLPQSEPTNDGDGNNGNLSYDFALYPQSLLPVQSVELTASLYAKEVNLKWNTINEVNTALFEIERSLDNNSFTKIGNKNSTADYGGNATYMFKDNLASVYNSIIYYRIKIIDKDLKYSYSKVVVVRLVPKQTISVWPNPFVSNIKITSNEEAASEVHIRITDVTGKIIKEQTFKVARGSNQLIINDLDKLAKGIYLVNVYNKNSNTHSTSKIIK